MVPHEQLGGAIMGRLVNCQEVCSHTKAFKESVGVVFRNAMWRGYPRRLVQSVWSRFLFQRWHSVEIRVKELLVWFSKIWSFLAKKDGRKILKPKKPAVPLKDLDGSIAILGRPMQCMRESNIMPGGVSAVPMQCDFSDAAVLTEIGQIGLNSNVVNSSTAYTQ